MPLRIIVISLLLFCCASPIAHATLPTNDALHTAIVSSSEQEITLNFLFPDLDPTEVVQNDETYESYIVAGEGTTYDNGQPILPAVTRFVVVPAQAGLELIIHADDPVVTRAVHAPVLCNDVNLDAVAQEDIDELYPPVVAEMSEPMVIRGVRLVKVTTYPVQYDRRSDSYILHESIVPEIRFTDDEPINPATHPIRRHRSREFLKYIQALAINGDDIRRDDPDDVSPYVGHYLVVTHENCLRYAAPFIEWRRKSGYKMDILSLSNDDANDPEVVKGQIQDRYDEYLDDGIDPFDQIILIGDREDYEYMGNGEWVLEAEYGNTIWGSSPNHADYLYACLEGDDHFPEAGFARLPSGSRDLMELAIGRIMAYEAEPYMEETEWFTKGAVYSQHWGLSNTSAWHIGISMNVRWGQSVLQHLGFDDIDFYEDLQWDEYAVRIGPWFKDIYDEGRNVLIGRAQLWNWKQHFNDVNDNVIFPINITTNGIGNWAANHMYRTGDGDHLKGPSVTTFAHGDTPTIPMSSVWLEMVNGLLLQDMTLGWARVLGVTALERYVPNFNYQGQPVHLHVKTDIDCFGDPGIQPWIGVPHIVEAEFSETITPGTRLIDVFVFNPEDDEAVAGAQVTVYAPGEMPAFDEDDYADYDDMITATTVTDEDGIARLIFDGQFEDDTPLYVTVTGRDILPYFGESEIDRPAGGVELSGYTLTETEGNEDNDVNPGETFELELTAFNPGRREDVPDVTAVISSLSPWVVVDEDANEIVFGDIDAGVEVEGEQVVTIHIDPTCPDVASRPHTAPSLLIEFVSGENSWSSAIQLEPVAPNFDMYEVIGGIIIPTDEEEYDLDIDIINVGAMDAPGVTARLERLGAGIAVIVDESQYEAMDAGDHNSLDGQDFVITVNALTVPGTMVDMLLILTSDDAFVDTVYFALQAGEPMENTPLGPDDYGYIAFDDTDEDWDMAPEYEWLEISQQEDDREFNGELIEFEGEAPYDIGEAMVIEMPFEMRFYGYEYDVITVATNGFIAVGDQEQVVNFQNWPLDRGIGGMGLIAPFWDWLEFGDNSAVYTYYDEESAQFIIEWYCLRHYDGGEDDLTFQVILYDPDVWVNETGDANIKFQYHSIENVEGPEHGRAERERNNYYASVGISSPDGTTGISYTWDNEYPINAAQLDEGRAIQFTTTPQFQDLVLGCVYGQVVDADDNAPIEDARILLISEWGLYARTDTDAEGNYLLEFPLFAALSFRITANKQDYNEGIAWGDISQDEDSTEINFELLHPEFALSVEEVSEMVCQEETVDIDFSIYNDGNGPLEWTIEKRLPDNAHYDPWRLRQSFFVGEAVEDTRIMGVVFADDHFYCTGGGNEINYVYIFNRDGEPTDRFEQFISSNYGIKDLAWDGELIWGIDGETVYGFTTEGEVQAEFEAPYNPTTALTWDPDRQLLWMCGIVTANIVGYSRDGEEVMRLPRQGFRTYGLAYWQDDPDGYPMYIFHKVGSDQQTVHKMDPETGDTMLVCIPTPEHGGKPEGAFITNQYDVYSWVFFGISNAGNDNGGDRIDVWQLESRTDWFNLNITEGDVEVNGEQELILRFDPMDLPLVSFEGSLVFHHNAAGGETALPVIMDVVVDVPQDDQAVQPTKFDLTAVYPNPFNAQATISYSVPYPSYVSLNVYDLSGRLVTTLADGDHSIGRHTLAWDGNGISSGIYWVSLESSDVRLIRKVVLMK